MEVTMYCILSQETTYTFAHCKVTKKRFNNHCFSVLES
jgi:hypothetical protein